MILDHYGLINERGHDAPNLLWVTRSFTRSEWTDLGMPTSIPKGCTLALVTQAFPDDQAAEDGEPCAVAAAFVELGEDPFDVGGQVARIVSEDLYGHHEASDWVLRDAA